jgi:diguanylate cyclase (GGDEF)-like protein
MLSTNPTLLKQALQQLEQATLDHAMWRDRLLRVISGRQPCDPNDLAEDAHHRCRFGHWYFELALPELREQPSFAMIGAEHESQHRIAARLLQNLSAGVPVDRTVIEEFEEASARLSYAMYFIRRELECALYSRDLLTEAHSSGEMVRDLREWHALAKQANRPCCIALVELDDIREINATHGYHVGAQALIKAAKIIAARLRASDKLFRYNGSKLLIRLSGTDLPSGKTVVMRLRDAVTQGISPVGADGVAFQVTASFGIAMLDPDVDVLESIDRADQALLLAKTAGRNRMIVWDPTVTTGVLLRRLEVKDVQS